jgi:hypothetical protein
MKQSSRRFSDINFSNQQQQQQQLLLLLPSTTQTKNNKVEKNSFNNLTSNGQLYNITERNNEHKQNEYIDNTSSSTPINSNGKLSLPLSDDSIIYIDSIVDNVDCLAPITDTSSFMTKSSSGSSSSYSIERLKLKEKEEVGKSSLKIRIDDDINHDYHAIDDCITKKKYILEPPSIPPPPLPPQPSSNITLLTNSIDTIEYTAKLKRQQKQHQQQQQNITENSNCYEKSWENSTNFLIDKLLNKYSVNIINNNSTSSFSNSSSTNSSSANSSNRNSTITQSATNNEQILLLQTQQLLKQNLMNSFKNVKQNKLSTSSSLSLSPTNTLSSTTSLFSNSTNSNNKTITGCILTPPQVPPPPLPLIEQVNRQTQNIIRTM